MFRKVWCVLVVLFGLAGTVQASPITVTNASFELPVLPEGGFNSVVPGWTVVSGSPGAYNPPATTATPTDGSNVLFLQALHTGSQGSVSQTLAAVLTANTLYTLLVDVGSRADFNFSLGYTVELLAGSTVLGTDSSPVPPSGSFIQASVQYTALAGDPLLGQVLGIRLSNVIPVASSTTTLMDNVRLDGSLVQDSGPTPVPEPGTALLLISGMAARRFLRRRRA